MVTKTYRILTENCFNRSRDFAHAHKLIYGYYHSAVGLHFDVIDTYSSFCRFAREAGSAAEEAATRKTAKYSNIQAHNIFQPVAVESLGPMNASGRVFLSKLGRKLADQSGDDREISFLFQRLSVLIQRYNAILLHDSFVKEEEE